MNLLSRVWNKWGNISVKGLAAVYITLWCVLMVYGFVFIFPGAPADRVLFVAYHTAVFGVICFMISWVVVSWSRR